MSESRPRFSGHVEPDAHTQELLESGWYDSHAAPSSRPSGSWWRNGALVVDDQGPGLVDADGIRHSLPVPPWGGKLVYATEYRLMSGRGVHIVTLFVTDEGDHPLFLLPNEGFSEQLARGFAEAAGLAFVVPDTRDGSELERRYPHYLSGPHPYYDLRRSREDRERGLTGRVRKLLGRKSPEV